MQRVKRGERGKEKRKERNEWKKRRENDKINEGKDGRRREWWDGEGLVKCLKCILVIALH